MTWLLASTGWTWVTGLFGGLIAGGGLNADGATRAQRLLGSAIVGLAVAGPVLLLLTHRSMRARAGRFLAVAASAALLGAFVTYRWWS